MRSGNLWDFAVVEFVERTCFSVQREGDVFKFGFNGLHAQFYAAVLNIIYDDLQISRTSHWVGVRRNFAVSLAYFATVVIFTYS